jgi:hypothetical protein
MRIVVAVVCLVSCADIVVAQNQSENPAAANDALGRPLKTDARGTQDTTAPTTTPSGGGAPASSPQGETPPGNMAAPDGSSKPVKPKE